MKLIKTMIVGILATLAIALVPSVASASTPNPANQYWAWVNALNYWNASGAIRSNTVISFVHTFPNVAGTDCRDGQTLACAYANGNGNWIMVDIDYNWTSTVAAKRHYCSVLTHEVGHLGQYALTGTMFHEASPWHVMHDPVLVTPGGCAGTPPA